jgi:hypothetical protein
VSIKALEIAEEKEAVAQFGSSDSGASLGDILGAALKKHPCHHCRTPVTGWIVNVPVQAGGRPPGILP